MVRLLACPGCCKCVFLYYGFLRVYAQQWDCWVMWQFYVQSILFSIVNHELPDVQAGFRKGRGTRIRWVIEKPREFQKNIYFCFIDYARAFVWITTNWKILKEILIPDHLTCLLRNLYAGQEETVRTGHTGLVPNWERSTSRLYIVTLLI